MDHPGSSSQPVRRNEADIFNSESRVVFVLLPLPGWRWAGLPGRLGDLLHLPASHGNKVWPLTPAVTANVQQGSL